MTAVIATRKMDGQLIVIGTSRGRMKIVPVNSMEEARKIRSRFERNEERRLIHESMTSLGMRRVKGGMGGTYYE